MNKSNNIHNWPVLRIISAGCIILAFVGLASCGAPGSARSFRNQTPKKNTGKPAQDDQIADFEKKVNAKKNSQEAAQEDIGTNEPDKPVRRIPTLREQINDLGAKQEALQSKVNTMASDVDELKVSVNSLRNEIKGTPKMTASAGPRKESKETLINSDEDSGDKVVYEDYSKSEKVKSDKPAGTSKKIKISKPKAAKKEGKKKKSAPSKSEAQKDKSDKPKTVSANKQAPAKADAPAKKSAPAKKETASAKNNDAAQLSSVMNFITKKNYTKAVEELNKTIQNTADPALINSCNYWLGESYFGMKQYDKSIPYFRKVVNSAAPQKKPEAIAMMAEAYMRAGNTGDAKKQFSELIEKFPKSQYVPHAKKMLQQL